jgi:uncharacterized protein (TIGR00725 family)
VSGRTACVFGSARLRAGEPEYLEARRLGELLARDGWTVCTGGYHGAMEAVSRGAREAGGHVVGITVADWDRRLAPNDWLVETRPAADLFVRMRELMIGDAWLAVAGGVGTLAEVALAWNLLQTGAVVDQPLVLMGRRWRSMLDAIGLHLVVGADDIGLVRLADGPEAAVALLR